VSGGKDDRPLRLLRVTHSLRRESGGPSESVRRSSLALARLGHEVEIVTLDRPEEYVAEDDLTVHCLGVQSSSYGRTPKLEPWLRSNHERFDAVLVHGLWQYQGWATFRTLNATCTPYLVFPHGMLDPWFRRNYRLKHAKKQAYWWMREYRVLKNAAAVCFTCDEERRLARESFWPYRLIERVVAYGTAAPSGSSEAQKKSWQACCPDLEGRPYLLFLGRIHPKKGIDLLLRAYAEVYSRIADAPVLVIAGPTEDVAYEHEMRALAASTCPASMVVWPGMLSGDTKWGALRMSEAFVLTSHQENFGIAVAEALACGRPVLISRQVNIWREVIDDGAGLVADDNVEGSIKLLSAWVDLDPLARVKMSEEAGRCFARRYEITQAAESLVAAVRECR
jgi:glycosyltransferase involved in cell wall biosynthesis